MLIIGSGLEGALAIASLKEKFGNDIIVVTPEEAKEQGLVPDDFVNTPKMKITAPPVMASMIQTDFQSGREKRRDRRKKQRKSK